MESTDVEYQEPLLHSQTLTFSKLKQEASPLKTAFSAGYERPYRDSIFTFLFLTSVLTTFTFGIIASTHTDPMNLDTKLRLSRFNLTNNKCEITQLQTVPEEDPDSISAFVTMTAIAFFISLALTFPLGLLLFSLLRRYTRPVMFLSAAIVALSPLVFWVYALSRCHGDPDKGCAKLGPVSDQITFLVGLPALSALLANMLRKNLKGGAFERGVQVLRMATKFLEEHFMLLIVNPMLVMGWMVFVNGPILTFIWYAFNVGEIVPDFDVVSDPTKGFELATGSPCCREERPGWIYAYITFASFTAFWVLCVSIRLSTLVTIETVTHWYFAPTGSATSGNIKRSLRNVYGPSFGTACSQGTIITELLVSLVGCLKKTSDLVLGINCQSSLLWGCFLRMFQFPKCGSMFASTSASISGDSFWESSKKSHYLLLRSSLKPAAESLTNLTLICTLLQTLVVYAVLECFSNATSETKFWIALLCFPLILVGLESVFVGAVSSFYFTVYICYAMEKDVREISKPEVCHALLAIPPSLPKNEA